MEQNFEWDSAKDEQNLQKHGISFYDAIEIFGTTHYTYPSSRNNETRSVGVGKVRDKIIAVVYTMRGDRIRIISARMARTKERILYSQHLIY